MFVKPIEAYSAPRNYQLFSSDYRYKHHAYCQCHISSSTAGRVGVCKSPCMQWSPCSGRQGWVRATEVGHPRGFHCPRTSARYVPVHFERVSLGMPRGKWIVPTSRPSAVSTHTRILSTWSVNHKCTCQRHASALYYRLTCLSSPIRSSFA